MPVVPRRLGSGTAVWHPDRESWLRRSRHFSSGLARRCFNPTDRVFKGEALLGDNGLCEPRLVAAQMRNQGLACTVVNQLPSFRGAPVKRFDRTGYKLMIVRARMTAGSVRNGLVWRRIAPLAHDR